MTRPYLLHTSFDDRVSLSQGLFASLILEEFVIVLSRLLGIVSAALIQLRCEFSLTDLAKEWVVASMLAGALVASLTGGK